MSKIKYATNKIKYTPKSNMPQNKLGPNIKCFSPETKGKMFGGFLKSATVWRLLLLHASVNMSNSSIMRYIGTVIPYIDILL